MTEEFKEWMDSDNVEYIGGNTYIEQTTQWRREFTLTELIEFYVKEYEVMGETCRNGKEWNKCQCC
jgi:hypothetical protein